MEKFLQFAFGFWLPVVAIGVGGFLVWRSLRWLSFGVLKPLVDRQITFMARVETFAQQQNETFHRLEQEFGRMGRSLSDIKELVDTASHSAMLPSQKPSKD